MNELEKRLQERLEWLEAGEPLETCLADLPEPEVELLALAAALRNVPYPLPDSETAVSQRAALQRLAMADPGKEMTQTGIFSTLRRWWSIQTVSRRYAAAALAAVLVILAAFSLSTLRSPAAVAPSPADFASEGVAADPIAQVPAGEPGGVSEAIVPPAELEEPANRLFIPLVASPIEFSPQKAVLENVHGVVEIQAEDGEWTAVSQVAAVTAGMRLRTGSLSQAAITFYDGSQARLGPDTELYLDTLDAQPPDTGFRTVVMTQWSGDSLHDVQFRNDSGSRYEVKTPNGSGIARGTTFQVLVSADSRAQYIVTEGRVDVTSRDVTVPVKAGHTSAIAPGETPSQPAFRITGEGLVTQTGAEWIIGGQTFLTDEHTILVGNPQVGDWVRVEGHLLADGSRLADRIILLSSSPANQFTITGQVDAITEASWTIAGQVVASDENTEIDAGIVVGDVVRVDGLIEENGSLLAERIRLVDADAGQPFEFVGVVETMSDSLWTISGVAIATDENTEIKGDPVVGDVVKVEGRILADGTWLAHEIKRSDTDENEFEITGEVQSIDPWLVSGVSFETRSWTEIDPGIVVGDLVKVEGRILADGAWVAEEIELIDEDESSLRFEFYGPVDSIDPWVVSGIPLPVTPETVVDEGIEVGDLVRVTARVLPDGSLVVERISLVHKAGDGEGCFSVTAVVISINGDELVLDDWPPINLGDVEIEGDLAVNSVVIINLCTSEDGTIRIISIIVVFTPGPVDKPSPGPDDDDDDEGKVTICHKPGSKNQHTLTISQSGLQGHLNHGDTIGACPSRGNDNGHDDDHDDDHDNDDD